MLRMWQRKKLGKILASLSLSALLVFNSTYAPIGVEAKSESETKVIKSQEEKEYTRFIIKYKNEQENKEISQQLKGKVSLGKKLKNTEVITSQAKLKVSDLMAELKQKKLDAYIEYIQPDYEVTLSSNDPLFSSQWGGGSTVSGEVYGYGANVVDAWKESQGEGVTVAVIDTGIDINHEDLQENIWVNVAEISGNGIDDDGNGYIDDVNGWNFNEDNNVVNKGDMEHGTHIAGIIAAVKDNGKGITGVAPKAKVMPLKVFNNGQAYTSDIIEGIGYAEKMGVKVVNCSWGSGEENLALKEAIESSNMLFVCAAGNNGVNIDTNPVYPASYPNENIITVGAINRNNNLASFSNYGVNSVDVVAPGVGIVSTSPANTYGEGSGTSMSAAFVSGEVALIWAKYSGLNGVGVYNKTIESTEYSKLLERKVFKILMGDATEGQATASIEKGETVQRSVYEKINSGLYLDPSELNLYSLINRFQASTDFSTVQGNNGWFYMEKTSTGYVNMTWDSSNNRWTGNNGLCLIWDSAQHPDVTDSVRKWVAPYSGDILITANGNIRKQNTGGGDGVKVRLFKNSVLLWEGAVGGTDGVGIKFPDRVEKVNTGDALFFEVNLNSNHLYDGTIWDPIIEYKGIASTNEAIGFEEQWNTQSYGLHDTNVISNNNGILKLSSTSNDPMIFMYNVGSFDPQVFRYMEIRYKMESGTPATGVETFFTSSQYPVETGEQRVGIDNLIADGQWHTCYLDMWSNPRYRTGGNITGWRYDWANNAGVTMELDYIRLVATDVITPIEPYITNSGILTSSSTFKVYANNVPVSIKRVLFPTYTIENGQDDIKWYEGRYSGNNTWEVLINPAKHNLESGNYRTDVYAIDSMGFSYYIGTSVIKYDFSGFRYLYDQNNRLVQIIKDTVPIIKYVYDNEGNLVRKQRQ